MTALRCTALTVACGAVLALAGCVGWAPVLSLDAPLELALGQSRWHPASGAVFTFLDVLEDSRCPRDVTCVWEGNARVRVRVSVAGQTATLLLNSVLDPRVQVFGGFRLAFDALLPYPTQPALNAPAYRLVLDVARVD